MNYLLVILRQLISIYIGSAILYLYYKVKGIAISFKQILNENDEFGLKKYRITAFYIGLGFVMFVLLIIVGIVRKYNL